MTRINKQCWAMYVFNFIITLFFWFVGETAFAIIATIMVLHLLYHLITWKET